MFSTLPNPATVESLPSIAGFSPPMLDRRARPLAAHVLRPLVRGPLGRLSPLTITGIGLTVGLGAALAAATGWWLVALGLWLANRLLDGVDGELARHNGSQSDRGGYLDICADITVYGALVLGIAVGHDHRTVWILAAVLLASFYLNTITWAALSALLEKRSAGAASTGEATSVTMPVGLVEGTETIVFVTVMLAAPGLIEWTMAVMAVAVTAGAVHRITVGVGLLRDPVVAEGRVRA